MITTHIDTEALILKTDALGHASMPTDRREAILDTFEQSGMSVAVFARQIGVKYPTFASWIQKLRGKRRKCTEKKLSRLAPSQITFVEAQIEQPCVKSCEGALKVEALGGVKLLVRSQNDVALAAELIRSLNRVKSC